MTMNHDDIRGLVLAAMSNMNLARGDLRTEWSFRREVAHLGGGSFLAGFRRGYPSFDVKIELKRRHQSVAPGVGRQAVLAKDLR
jgi:hypothetical protein